MRYLDASKLQWLIEDNGLFFSAASNQSDENEGIYDHTFLSREMIKSNVPIDEETSAGIDELILGYMTGCRQGNFLNCWYIGSSESLPMWNEFGQNGIVIFSDDWTLRDALPKPLDQATKYYDVIYSDELKPHANHEPLRIKNSKFKNEKEFRIVFDLVRYSVLTGFEPSIRVLIGGVDSHECEEINQCMSPVDLAQSHHVLRRKGSGFLFNYSLSSIIKEVRIHPSSTDERLEEIRNLFHAAGIYCPVNHSSLRSA